jgi:hypothetical protein
MKYIIGFLLLFVIALVLSYVLRDKILSDSPPFVIDKLEELKANTVLMDSIGEDNQFEFSYNKNDYHRKDTLSWRLLLRGPKGTLDYEAVHLYENSTWILYREKMEIIPN